MEGNLKENGWFLSSEGIAACKKACMKENPSTSECLRAAANLDLKIYGTRFLPEDINKGKIELVKGPGVLQIQKLHNVSAPKANEDSTHAPRLLKFYLTDGPISCQGLEYSAISDLSLSTPPGTKICLIGSVPVKNGMLLLDEGNTKVIGGEVDSLINKWKLNKSLAKHSRNTGSAEGGPPPFVPFNQAKSRDENRARGGYFPNGHEFRGDSQRRPNDRYREQENHRRGRDREDQGNRPHRPGDSFRGRDRRNLNRPNQRGHRDTRVGNRNYESNTPMNSDRYNQRRTDHNRLERNDRKDSGGDSPPNCSRTGPGIRENGTSDVSSRDDDRPIDGNGRGRGGSRGGRGGRRDGVGRGRSGSLDQDETDDYRARQPSDKGTLWDFVKLSIESPPKSSTPDVEKEPEEGEPDLSEPTEETLPESPESSVKEQSETTNNISQPTTEQQQQPEKRPQTETRQTNNSSKEQKVKIKTSEQKHKEPEKNSRNQDSSFSSNRDHKQRSYQQRQQQSSGQGRGRGPRGRHDDGRSYNQSLPPRLQKKQQQQYQQQQHFMAIDKEPRDKSSSPGSGSGSETRQSPSVDSSPSSKSSDDMKQTRRQYQKQQQQRAVNEQPKQSQCETMSSSYLMTQQAPFHVEQQQVYEQHDNSSIMQQEYSYQQQPPPPPPQQQYPVYQMQTQMAPPQAVMVTQPITSPSQQHIQTPITTAQIRWKKGTQCLALRRDGQYYSAKIEHVTPDGQQCMVSFQDFHGGCEMASIASLRPFPIIAWTEPNAQSMPATTMAPVPVYAQPTQVAMVPRPQVMVPVQAQPQAYIAPKGPIASPNVAPPQGLPQPPPGMQWQQVGYHDIRTQPTYQPMIHYDPMTQSPVRQAYYPMPPAGTVQFVRGVKELHGQDLYPGHMNENVESGTKIQPTTTVYYNMKGKKAVPVRPPQAVYVTPRQQAYETNN